MTDAWFVDNDTCKKCGTCVDLCPNRILQMDENNFISFRKDRLWMCFQCGHCMAGCPTESIHIPGLSYEEDFSALPAVTIDAGEQFSNLITRRRAFRCFQKRPVPRDLLEKIVESIQQAPPGFPPLKTELTIVIDPEKVIGALPLFIEFYEFLINTMKNPIASQFLRLKAGREKYIILKEHVIPLMVERMPDLKSGKEDTILRHAPALILFHANRNTENYRTDIHVALTYGLLAAHSLGLGSSAMDLIPPAIEKSKALRAYFQIPEGNEVVASMILGFPKHHFLRSIHRELKSVTWI